MDYGFRGGEVDNKSLVDVDGDGDTIDRYFKSLPPGWRFMPSDGELLVYYLRKKALGLPLPFHRIRTINIYQYHPRQLSEMFELMKGREQAWYFFTPRDKKYRGGTRPSRSAYGGFWKASGKENPVSFMGQTVGKKMSMVFNEGSPKCATKTNWLIQEYTLEKHAIPPTSRPPGDMKLDDWVLCKLYYHKKGTEEAEKTEMINNQHAEDKPPESEKPELINNQNPEEEPQLRPFPPSFICNNAEGDDGSLDYELEEGDDVSLYYELEKYCSCTKARDMGLQTEAVSDDFFDGLEDLPIVKKMKSWSELA